MFNKKIEKSNSVIYLTLYHINNNKYDCKRRLSERY